jgi:hypothetical protein
MSAYLSRLIDRTQGCAPALQRRRAALFEPVVPWTGSMTGSTTASQDGAFERREPATASRRANVSDPDTHYSPDSPMQPKTAASHGQAVPGASMSHTMPGDDRPSQAERTSTQTTMPPHGTSVKDAGDLAWTPPDTKPAPPRAPSIDATSSDSAEREAREARVRVPEAHSPAHLSRPDSPAFATPMASRSHASHAGIEDSSQTVPRTSATAPRTTTPTARTTVTRTVFQPGSPAAAQTAAASPTVQITIGRIEVRAISEPARGAQRVAHAAAPRLSLDDYLRARGGTRR